MRLWEEPTTYVRTKLELWLWIRWHLLLTGTDKLKSTTTSSNRLTSKIISPMKIIRNYMRSRAVLTVALCCDPKSRGLQQKLQFLTLLRKWAITMRPSDKLTQQSSSSPLTLKERGCQSFLNKVTCNWFSLREPLRLFLRHAINGCAEKPGKFKLLIKPLRKPWRTLLLRWPKGPLEPCV